MAHAHHHNIPVNTEGQQGVRKGATFIIGGLTSGHGVFHWFTRSFEVMMPEVRDAFGLSGVGVGGIATTRELVSGIIALPGGIVTDLLRRYWGWVLAVCMATFGLGWLVIGFSPVYPLLLLGMALVAMAASIWHLPAMSALSHHFSHTRGAALSFHGVGGQVGDAIAPVATGLLLGVLAWNQLISIYAIVPLFLTFLVFWAFRDLGRSGPQQEVKPDVRSQLTQSAKLLSNPRLLVITLVAGLRGMAFVAYIPFLTLYLNDELLLSAQARGVHLTVLVIVGIVSTPVMGYLSDRFGRKLVLIPGMLFLGVLTVLLVPYGQGILLLVILALLGTFLFSDQPILTAAALDIVGEGVAASTLGVLSFSRFVLSASSPLIAGYLYNQNSDFTFYYIAGLFGIAAIILLFLRLPKVQPAGHHDQGHDGHGHGHGEHSPDRNAEGHGHHDHEGEHHQH
ncbi:MAG: MFS transporter [Chloroflexi bacterium]|nr:MFS transporter [Chloroflexota bacterium]MDA1218668.1 MFS transporter [Chloroflexota bacterium]